MKKIGIGCLISIVVLVITFVIYGIGVKNKYIDLENRYTKQTAKIETYHDKMWKTIQSGAKINEQKKNDFKEVYSAIMEGRYSGGSQDGSLMKWIQEDNPQFDQSSYSKLMTIVEAERTGFFNEQDIIQGIVAIMNGMKQKFPTKYFLTDKEIIVFVPISSKVSKEVMDSRTDDDLHL